MGAEVCVVKYGVHPRTLLGAWGRLLDRVSEGSWETTRNNPEQSGSKQTVENFPAWTQVILLSFLFCREAKNSVLHVTAQPLRLLEGPPPVVVSSRLSSLCVSTAFPFPPPHS